MALAQNQPPPPTQLKLAKRQLVKPTGKAGNGLTLFCYRVPAKKMYTALYRYCSTLRPDMWINYIQSDRRIFDLAFDTLFLEIEQKLTEL